MEQDEIVVYKAALDADLKLEVRVEDDTVWLTQKQIADLFGTQRPAITKHLKNIYKSGELDESSTCSILEHMGAGGTQKYKTRYYSLDAILSVGYRVNSKNATHFRIWANKVLKEYLLRGHVFNHRFEKIERKLFEHDQKFELIINAGLKPSEGIFYDGQIFDAWEFVYKLVKGARHSITLIDNYIDESVLGLLAKRAPQVKAAIYTAKTDPQMHINREAQINTNF